MSGRLLGVGPKRTFADEVFDPHPCERKQRRDLRASELVTCVRRVHPQGRPQNVAKVVAGRPLGTCSYASASCASAVNPRAWTTHPPGLCGDSPSTRAGLLSAFIPCDPSHLPALTSRGSRIYNCSFSSSGDFLVAGSQDSNITVYDTQSWAISKAVSARNVSWTVTSVDISPDEAWLVYSSMNDKLQLVSMPQKTPPGDAEEQWDGGWGSPSSANEQAEAQAQGNAFSLSPFVQSESSLYALDGAGETPCVDVGQGNTAPRGHGYLSSRTYASRTTGKGEGEELVLDPSSRGFGRGFGVFTCKWSPGGGEIVAGCSNNKIVIYDAAAKRVVESVSAHTDDINSVCFAGTGLDADTIVSGSDDRLIKVFDRRTMSASSPSSVGERRRSTAAIAVGVLPGHSEGVTHVCARGDGHYIVSNGKDQTAKLWDIRRMLTSESEIRDAVQSSPIRSGFDYRWQRYPIPQDWGGRNHPSDASIATFRGHSVQTTLIRAGFSPAATTGQRFIYSGSADARVYMWDVLTGDLHAVLSRKGELGEFHLQERAEKNAADFVHEKTGRTFVYESAETANFHSLLLRSAFAPDDEQQGSHERMLMYSGGDQRHSGVIRDVAWHPTQQVLATASFDGTLGLWTFDERAARLQGRLREARYWHGRETRQANARARRELRSFRKNGVSSRTRAKRAVCEEPVGAEAGDEEECEVEEEEGCVRFPCRGAFQEAEQVLGRALLREWASQVAGQEEEDEEEEEEEEEEEDDEEEVEEEVVDDGEDFYEGEEDMEDLDDDAVNVVARALRIRAAMLDASGALGEWSGNAEPDSKDDG